MREGLLRVYEFGPLRLDAAQHTLFCKGDVLALPPRLFHILLILVENEGRLVSQEVLRSRIWPDSFVEDAAVSKNVSSLRVALRGWVGPLEVIGTVSKKGYQILLPVTLLPEPGEVEAAAEPPAEPTPEFESLDTRPLIAAPDPDIAPQVTQENKKEPTRRRWLFAVSFTAILALAAFLIRTHLRSPPWFLAGTLSPVALTPGNDIETMPAISPDGRTLAYVTRQTESSHFKIYLRALGDRGSFGEPLDTGPGEAFFPAWSPDGRTFAFLRCAVGPCEISTIPVQGGPVRVVRALPRFSLFDDRPYYMYLRLNPVWTADGKSLIFPYRDVEGDSQRLVQYDLDTNAEEKLTSGRLWDEDHAPTLSPDGKSLAFLRNNLSYVDVMTVDLGSHRQTTLAAHLPLPTNGLAWSPDGRGLVLSRSEPGKPCALWDLPLAGAPRQIPVALDSPQAPVFAPDGKTLLALSVTSSQSLAFVDAAKPGQPHELFASHQHDSAVAFARDGKTIALLSDRSGTTEVWLAEMTAAGAVNARQLTHGVVHDTNFLAWSPDGQQLALGNGKERGSLWIVDVHTGLLKTLHVPQLEKSLIFSPVWAEDKRSLYAVVSGDNSGVFQIGLGENTPIRQLVEDHTLLLRIDGDRALYYTRRSGTGLFKIDLQAGKPVAELVPTFRNVRTSLAWTISDHSLEFVDLYDVQRRLQHYDLVTKALTSDQEQLPGIVFTSATLSRSAASHATIFSHWSPTSGSRVVMLQPQE